MWGLHIALVLHPVCSLPGVP
ncbi:hypothetical protein LINPERPRIM_LOCUS11863 [Linum perenne]